MIRDGENTFFNKQKLEAKEIDSNVIQVGEGETGEPMWLVLTAENTVNPTSGTGAITTVLETSNTEDFTTATTLATYSSLPLHAKLPRGNKKYLRLKATSTFTGGTMTAALVYDDDVI